MTLPHEADLPGARAALADAIHALAGRTATTITRDNGETNIVFGDSILTQLVDYTAGAQGTSNGSHARSMPPVVLDAIRLRTDIDSRVRDWWPRPHALPTSDRLHALADHHWRPQDVPDITAITTTINSWTTKARTLIDPPRRWTLPTPCPACGQATIHRPDSTGEHVRQPALQISATGCECMACHTVWTPELYVHLARVLGTMPTNVLE